MSTDVADESAAFRAEIAAFRFELRQGFARQRRWLAFFWATILLEIILLKLL